MNAVRNSARFPEFIARLKESVLDYLDYVWYEEYRGNDLILTDEDYYRDTFLHFAVNGTEYTYWDYAEDMDDLSPIHTMGIWLLMDLQNYINSYLHDQLGNDRENIIWTTEKLFSLTAYVIAHREITFEEFSGMIIRRRDYMNRNGIPRQ